MDKTLSLPKTSNRVMFEHYYDEANVLVDKIENLKTTLPAEILKQVNEEVKQSIIKARLEMIDMSNNHKEALSTMNKNTVSNIENALNNNTISIANHINNSMLYLGLFGVFCGLIGGLVFWLAKSFIG